jgi:hypothetical protein
MFQVQQQRAWHDIVTFDESWFYCITDNKLIWLRSGENVAEAPHVTVQYKKLMVTIVWIPTGFQVIRVLPSGRTFNSNYYQSDGLGPLSE